MQALIANREDMLMRRDYPSLTAQVNPVPAAFSTLVLEYGPHKFLHGRFTEQKARLDLAYLQNANARFRSGPKVLYKLNVKMRSRGQTI